MRWFLRRLVFYVFAVWVALTLNFLLPRLMPGNPALAMLSKFHGELTPQTLKEAFDACFNPALGSLTEEDWARPAIT